MRRLLAAAALAAALMLPALAAAPGRADQGLDARRAVVSYDAMQRYLFDRRTGRYKESLDAGPGAHAWPFSQALAASVAVARLSPSRAGDVVRRLGALEQRFRAGAAYAAWPGGDVYFDDNEWIAEALLDWSEVTDDRRPFARAAEVFGVVAGAWDSDPSHPCAGGVYWTNASANRDRNTVTTGSAALLALRLYAASHDRRYLGWAKRSLAWVDRCMLSPDGLYWDHIRLDGRVDETHWSYNQGILIGAFLGLYRLTGDARALVRAESLADAALAYFGDRWDADEPAVFAAVFFRHLLALAPVAGRPDYVEAAEAYGDAAWSSARDPRSGLFSVGGEASLLDQAALVQLYAALALQRPVVRGGASAPLRGAPVPS